MKIFNFFKKKDVQHPPKETEKGISKVDRKKHEFIEKCEYLKEEYGLIIPDIYKDFFTKNQIDKNHIYYRIFWELWDYNDLQFVFYTENFVRYLIKRFDETFGNDADWKILQDILEEGECEYKSKENKFEAEHIDLSFLDQCYEECGRNREDLMIALNIYADCGGGEYLILSSEKKGYSGGCYHGMTADIHYNNIIIKYRVLQHYKLVSDSILEIKPTNPQKKSEHIPHEFEERCQLLKEEIGLEVPQSVIECFKRYNLPKNNYFYSIFWHVDHDSFIIFYTEAFIELAVTRYKAIHGQNVDLAELSEQLDDAMYEYRIKENCFDRTNPDFEFINTCYEEFKKTGEELIITMDLGDHDNLVLNKEEKGNIGYNLSTYKTTAGIQYKYLTHFKPLPELIKGSFGWQ
jgi:hypothetical protein